MSKLFAVSKLMSNFASQIANINNDFLTNPYLLTKNKAYEKDSIFTRTHDAIRCGGER